MGLLRTIFVKSETLLTAELVTDRVSKHFKDQFCSIEGTRLVKGHVAEGRPIHNYEPI